jgi:bifunctional DNase/RNase
MHTVEVLGIRLDDAGNAPILLLQEMGGSERVLEIWIGAVEAGAIAFAEQGITPPRPMTHDLLLACLNAANVSITHARLTGIQDGVYIAELVLTNGEVVSARPSDAVAVALRASVPILASDSLLDEVGITVDGDKPPTSTEDEIEAFRSFLDELNPEDFGKTEG